MKVEINYAELCPALKDLLKSRPLKGIPGRAHIISIDLERENEHSSLCAEGQEFSPDTPVGPNAVLDPKIDLMIAKSGIFNLKCEGCQLLPRGFEIPVIRSFSVFS